jgi:hypothetical protein
MRTYQKRCGRCGGSGFWFDRGLCFNCRGAGQVTVTVRTAEEKAASKTLFERATRAYQTVRETAAALYEAGKMDYEAAWYAEHGVNELREREPERYAKMLDSLDAGRIEETVIALSVYCAAGYPIWYGGQ